MGVKALIYFEIVTTAALFIGLAVVNFTKPGVGVVLAAEQQRRSCKQIATDPSQDAWSRRWSTRFPSSVVEAMVRGDVLQIVAFAVLFAHGRLGYRRKRKTDPARRWKASRR